MSLTESLTVEIVADATALESELARAAGLVDGLSARLSGVGTAADGAARSLRGIGEAVRPVSTLSGTIGRLVGQLRGIGQTPLTINTAPATASLAALSRQIASVAAQLAALNRTPVGPSTSGPSPGGGFPGGGLSGGGFSPDALTADRMSRGGPNLGGPNLGEPSGVSRFAAGGAVFGPPGVDRVPAMLTAGEFVLSADAAHRLGRPTLDRLNDGRRVSPVETDASTADRSPSRIPAVSQPPFSEPPVFASLTSPDGRPAVTTARQTAATNPSLPATTAARETASSAPPTPPPAGPVFNDITVQVTQQVDLDDLLRELELGRTTTLDRLA